MNVISRRAARVAVLATAALGVVMLVAPPAGAVLTGIDADPFTLSEGFESGSLTGYSAVGATSVVSSLGPISPSTGSSMAAIGTGDGAVPVNSGRYTEGSGLGIPRSPVPHAAVRISFRWNMVTGEYGANDKYTQRGFRDAFAARVLDGSPEGRTVVEFAATDDGLFTAVPGLTLTDQYGSDDTVGQTGWQNAEVSLTAEEAAGPTGLQFDVWDVRDPYVPSVVLVDDISVEQGPFTCDLDGVSTSLSHEDAVSVHSALQARAPAAAAGFAQDPCRWYASSLDPGHATLASGVNPGAPDPELPAELIFQAAGDRTTWEILRGYDQPFTLGTTELKARCFDLRTNFPVVLELPILSLPTGARTGHIEVKQTICAADAPNLSYPVLTNGRAHRGDGGFWTWDPPDPPTTVDPASNVALLNFVPAPGGPAPGVRNWTVNGNQTGVTAQVGVIEQVAGIAVGPFGGGSPTPGYKSITFRFAATDVCGGPGRPACP